MEARPLLSQEEAKLQLNTYREVSRQHDALDRTVGHLARTSDGEFLVRGWTEEGELKQYREAKAALPELTEPPPGHYFRDVAYVIHDTRTKILPKDREEQTRMNVAYGVIVRHLEAY